MGHTPDDIEGGLTDTAKVIMRDEGETLDSPGEFRWNATTGSYEMLDDEGVFNPRDAGVSPNWKKQARLQCPTQHWSAGNSWAEAGSVFYDYDEYGQTTVRRWTGMGYGGMQLRAILESDGTVLGFANVITTAFQLVTFELTNLPTADDAIVLQLKKLGTRGTIVAGQFEFIEE